MMNWKDVPHLFLNGKFKIIEDGEDPMTACGYDFQDNVFLFGGISIKDNSYQKIVPVKYCKLIARPMSDMSDEEFKEIAGNSLMGEVAIKGYKEILIEHSELGIIWFNEMIHLLNIGVLPESLADEDVIWRNENG